MNLWPYMAVLGGISLALLLLSYLTREAPVPLTKSRVPFNRVASSPVPILEMPLETAGPLHASIRSLLGRTIQTQIVQLAPSILGIFNSKDTPKEDGSIYSRMVLSNMDGPAKGLALAVANARAVQLHERILHGCICILTNHVKMYKNARKELERGRSSPTKKGAHIDDYNDYNLTEDGVTWRRDLENINARILSRIQAAGELHVAAGKGKQEEMQYLRTSISRFEEQSGRASIFGTSSNILKVLLRETIIGKVVWPLLHKLWTPYYLNCWLLEKVYVFDSGKPAYDSFESCQHFPFPAGHLI